MFAQRVAIVLAGSSALACLPAPAFAQVPEGVTLNILRECSRIDDPSARLACYDNNMRAAGGQARNTIPGQVQVQGGGAVSTDGRPAGFGREDLPVPQAAQAQSYGPDEITATVTEVTQRGPGIYLLTLEGDAQWVFTEGVSMSYNPPRRGSRVEIMRGAMDSFLLRFDNQESVRVRRVQ
ncbi:hypothetical protein [Alteraurantiacibacter buctensis]|uniref:Uncharacterized protein n=1 Tax=Alteraurantiacibacter buctensis TaxID=1503981 RepID=A0A844YYI8_9SPHN|nr:hypothetical protein [Alteraurantiacibacter buctensis]MXO72242.1 hypothetical protein [Alteraurantiacibacter buctensis]